MKWYWAILLTIALFGGMAALVQIGGDKGATYIPFFIALFAVWAAGKSGSVSWGLFVLFLWPIGFPCFLISQYKRTSNVA